MGAMTKLSLPALCNIWLANRAEPTQKNYRALIENADMVSRILYGKSVVFLDLEQLQSVWNSTTGKYSKRSQSVRHFIFRSFFNTVRQLGLREDHPMALLRPPKFEDTLADRILTHDDVLRLLAAASCVRDRLLMQTMYQAGLRVNEACRLRKGDILANGVFTLRVWGKGQRTDYVRVSDELGRALVEWAADKDFLFAPAGAEHKPLSPIHAWKIVKKAGQAAGIPRVSPHFLRHTHASVALRNGAQLPVIQKSMRHKSITTTMKYLHLEPNEGSSLFLPPLAPKKPE